MKVRALVSFALAGWLALPIAGSSATPAAPDAVIAHAIDQYRLGRLAAAYGRFVELANRGDADAARIALFMHHYGPLLYGKYWDADAADLEDWARLAEGHKGRAAPAYRPTPGTGPGPRRVEPVRGPR